jgi:4-carboxymuconolactone decarboxylase
MSADETTIYDFVSELLATGQVSDAAFDEVKARWGERGVIDLTATVGYYCVASLVLNVSRHPMPEGVAPLKSLKK